MIGNAPFIVSGDAPVDKAVAGVIAAKFRGGGQTCVCTNCVFVHESIYDQFARALVDQMRIKRLGYGFALATTHRPLIHGASLRKVQEHVRGAVDRGAILICGDKARLDLGSNYHELTVLGGFTPEMRIFNEETFGSVCLLIKFLLKEEVVVLANDSELGLAGYFYTNDVLRVFHVVEQLEVSMKGVNTGAISEVSLPFIGIKESGFGRKGSKYGYADYTVMSSVV